MQRYIPSTATRQIRRTTKQPMSLGIGVSYPPTLYTLTIIKAGRDNCAAAVCLVAGHKLFKEVAGPHGKEATHNLSQQANLCPLPSSRSIQLPTYHTNRESSKILRISTIIHTTPTHSLATSMTWLSIAHAPSLPGLALPMPSQTEILATLTKHPRHTGSTHSLPTSRTLSAWRSMAHTPNLPLWLCQYGDNSYRNCLELNCPATLKHPHVKRSIPSTRKDPSSLPLPSRHPESARAQAHNLRG